MPFKLNPTDMSIQMACGDTADIQFHVNWDTLSDGDVMLFAIFTNTTCEDVLCKCLEISDGVAHLRLCNQDTRDIPAGKYYWNLRIVTSPARDAEGNVRVDADTDDVITIYDKPPCIQLKRSGAYV